MAFDPPSPEVPWWKKDYEDALNQNPEMKENWRNRVPNCKGP